MWTLMLEGGYPMWFLLVFGLATLGASGFFAFRPSARGLRLALGLGVTTLFSIATGIVSDFAAVGHGAAGYLMRHPDQGWTAVLLQGFGESMSPGILGFSILTMASLLISLGVFRGFGE